MLREATGRTGRERRSAIPVVVVLIGMAAIVAFLMFAERSAATTLDAACQQDHNIEVDHNGQVIENVTLLNARSSAIYINGYSNVTVRNVTIKNYNCDGGGAENDAGIACWGCTALTAVNNVIQGPPPDGNRGTIEGNGIWVKNSGGNHLISGNTITGGWDAIGGEDEGSATGTFNRDSVVENNTISNCEDDGIQSEGGNKNVTIRGNIVEGCLASVAFAPSFVGPLTVEDNVFDHPSEKCYKVGDGGSGTVYLTRNTCISDDKGIEQSNPGMGYAIVSRGNIYDVHSDVVEMNFGPLAPGSSFDGDCLYVDPGQRWVKWTPSTNYDSLAAWQTGTGEELNAVTDLDCDGDGFSNALELFIGSGASPRVSPAARCADSWYPPVGNINDESDDQWPSDLNDDGRTNLADMNLFFYPVRRFLVPANYNARWDLNASGSINLADFNLLSTVRPPMFGGQRAWTKQCVPD